MDDARGFKGPPLEARKWGCQIQKKQIRLKWNRYIIMLASKFLNPRNDAVFKRIFGSEKNKDILIHFLNDILIRKVPIKDVTFLKTIQDSEIAPLRVSIVDVMCEDRDKNRFIIEMQLAHEKAFDRRVLYYAARAYCSQRTKDKPYKDLKDVYFLAITDFTPFPNKKNWISHIGLTDLHTNEHYIKAIQLFFMQLPLFKKTKKDLSRMTVREKWAYFFKYADETKEEDLEKIIGKDTIIKRAYDELNRFAWSEQALNEYESVEMKKFADQAIQEAAYERGEKRGEKKKALEIAQNMLQQNLSAKQISTLTGLSEKEIKSLKK
jgi:predicted transposase/invertase (TIGR01784 family)